MIVSIVILSFILLAIGFAVYITGVISAKIDLIIAYAKLISENNRESEEYKVKNQFMNMMNYTAGEKMYEDE